MAAVSGIEETLRIIEAQELVVGTIVVDANGVPIRTNLPINKAHWYVGLLRNLAMMARSTIRELDPQDDLDFFSIRAHPHEFKITPSNDLLLITILKIRQ